MLYLIIYYYELILLVVINILCVIVNKIDKNGFF